MKTNTQEQTKTLETRRFIESIQQDPAFAETISTQRLSELDPRQRREHLVGAVAAGALSIATELEEERGEYDLDANLYRLVGKLGAFYKSSVIIDELREKYESSRDMPQTEKRVFYSNKDTVTEFNHILGEVINAGASKFTFDELLTFMTNMHAASGNRENTGDFYTHAKRALIGMRSELAVEQVLIANGIDYSLGDLEQESKGGDVIINDIPIDIKSSLQATERAKERAKRNGWNPDRIVWSHITPKDFDGKLTLPYDRIEEIFARIKPDLDKAIQ